MKAQIGAIFDLDGTLVITDQIYFVVWYEILINYNIVLNKEIFAKYIQGNNDKYVLNTLLQNIDLLLDDESSHLAGLSDFIGKPISLQSEPSMGPEQYDIVLL